MEVGVGATEIAWHTDGSFATVGIDGTIRRWSPDGASQGFTAVFADDGFATFAASGQRLQGEAIDLVGRMTYVIETDGGERLTLDPVEFDDYIASGLDFSAWRERNAPKEAAVDLVQGFSSDWTLSDGSTVPLEAVAPGVVPLRSQLPGVERLLLSETMTTRFECDWSPRSSTIAYAGRDRLIWLCDSRTGNPRRVVIGHERWTEGVDWNHDGSRLASLSGDCMLNVWTKDGALTARWKCHTLKPRFVEWSPDGSRVATGGFWTDATVRIWNPDGGAGPVMHCPSIPGAVAWKPDGTTIAVADDDQRMILLFDASDGREVARLGPMPKSTRALAWNSDGTRLASGGGDWEKGVGGFVWDVEKREPIVELEKRRTWFNWLGWNGQGDLAAATQDRYVQLHDVETGRILWQFEPQLDGLEDMKKASWSPDGERLADGAGRIWKLDESRKSFRVESDVSRTRLTVGLYDVAWSPDGASLAVSGASGALRALASDGSGGIAAEASQETRSHVAWHPDGDRFATGTSSGKKVEIWNREGERLMELAGHTGDVRSVRWNSDGSLLASASMDGDVRLWSDDGSPGAVLNAHEGGARHAVWSPQEDLLASGGVDGAVRLWNADGTPLLNWQAHERGVNWLAWSPDGRRIATGGIEDGALRLWNAENGELITEATVGSPEIEVSWSPDGSRLASRATGDRNIRLWNDDLSTRGALATETTPMSVAWSPKGDSLAVSFHSCIRILDGEGRVEATYLPLSSGETISVSSNGEPLSGTPQSLEEDYVYLVQPPGGGAAFDVLTPSQFEAFRTSGRDFREWRVDAFGDLSDAAVSEANAD